MTNTIEDRIKNIMSAVFGLSIDKITDDSSPDTIVSWDSLKHMNLIASLEEEFAVEFTDDEIIEMMSYLLIKEILKAAIK